MLGILATFSAAACWAICGPPVGCEFCWVVYRLLATAIAGTEMPDTTVDWVMIVCGVINCGVTTSDDDELVVVTFAAPAVWNRASTLYK